VACKRRILGSLSQAKTLGGIGAIFTLLLFVPFFIGGVLVVVGWILILLALKRVSDAVQDKSIYSNALISAATAILGTVVFAILVAAAIASFVGMGAAPTPSTVTPGFVAVILGVIGGLVAVWVLAIISAYFLRKSFKSVATRLNMSLFGTAALLYFIGAILTIVVVGIALVFVAEILFIIAFFTMPDDPPAAMMQPQPMAPAQPPPTPQM
jgi:uncharacterized membrane protein